MPKLFLGQFCEARDDLSNSGEAGTGTTYERKDKTSSITISVRNYAFSSPDTSIRGLLAALVAIGTDFIPSFLWFFQVKVPDALESQSMKGLGQNNISSGILIATAGSAGPSY